jgi:hypothetical protein
VIDCPSSGIKLLNDVTITGEVLGCSTGDPPNAIGVPLLESAFGLESISPVRRSFQMISTARLVSASRISFSWFRLMTFLE